MLEGPGIRLVCAKVKKELSGSARISEVVIRVRAEDPGKGAKCLQQSADLFRRNVASCAPVVMHHVTKPVEGLGTHTLNSKLWTLLDDGTHVPGRTPRQAPKQEIR